MDPRRNLQRRYDMQEILELHKGKPKIKGLNYDALHMLRNPLYVKMGQELKDESQVQHNKIIMQLDHTNQMKRQSDDCTSFSSIQTPRI